MCGRTLTGKSEQAIRLADRYCLKVSLLVEHRRWVMKRDPTSGYNIDLETAHKIFARHNAQVLSAEELAQKAMDNAANAMATGRKTLSREEALGQEASSALLQGGTISDKVKYCGWSVGEFSAVVLLKFPHAKEVQTTIGEVFLSASGCHSARKRTCPKLLPNRGFEAFASLV